MILWSVWQAKILVYIAYRPKWRYQIVFFHGKQHQKLQSTYRWCFERKHKTNCQQTINGEHLQANLIENETTNERMSEFEIIVVMNSKFAYEYSMWIYEYVCVCIAIMCAANGGSNECGCCCYRWCWKHTVFFALK